MIDWKPIDRAPRQTMVLVGHEAFRGRFKVAEMDALGDWYEALSSRPLGWRPTHYAEIDPPPFTNLVSVTGRA